MLEPIVVQQVLAHQQKIDLANEVHLVEKFEICGVIVSFIDGISHINNMQELEPESNTDVSPTSGR